MSSKARVLLYNGPSQWSNAQRVRRSCQNVARICRQFLFQYSMASSTLVQIVRPFVKSVQAKVTADYILANPICHLEFFSITASLTNVFLQIADTKAFSETQG